MRATLVCLMIALPGLAGCFSEDAAPAADTTVAASAQEAGARTGPAPAAPKEAFVVAADGEPEVVAYPATLDTNPARDPVTLDLSGEFAPQDCVPGVNVGGVRSSWHGGDFGDALQVGDVFAYEMTLTYENSDSSWAEIHPILGVGNSVQAHSDPTQSVRGPVVINFTGQGYRVSDDDMSWYGVQCWFGQTAQPIPYTLTLAFTFAEGAVPAEAPIRVPIPPNATRMFVRGVALDGAEGVLSHYRVFGPDDQLLCECSLESNEEADTFEIEAEGDHVVLVDHTANGFVSLAFDAPPVADLEAMQAEWIVYPVYEGDGEASVDATVEIDVPRVPLLMHSFVAGSGEPAVGIGKKTAVSATNERGEVLRIAWGGHFAASPADGLNFWFGIWPDDWEYFVDHHAYTNGPHQVNVKAEGLRGEVSIITRQYVR